MFIFTPLLRAAVRGHNKAYLEAKNMSICININIMQDILSVLEYQDYVRILSFQRFLKDVFENKSLNLPSLIFIISKKCFSQYSNRRIF